VGANPPQRLDGGLAVADRGNDPDAGIRFQRAPEEAADRRGIVHQHHAVWLRAGAMGQAGRRNRHHSIPIWASLDWMMSLSNGFMMYSSAPAPIASLMCRRSFSVVQNTTIGERPCSLARSVRRKS